MPSSDDIRMVCTPPWALGRMWPHVGPLLIRGVLANETDPEFVRGDLGKLADGIVDGRHQLWVVLKDGRGDLLAAFCTSIMRDDDGAPYVLVHSCAGGSVWDWGQLLAPTLDAFAKAEGCSSIRYEGDGWRRFLPATPVAGEYVRALQ